MLFVVAGASVPVCPVHSSGVGVRGRGERVSRRTLLQRRQERLRVLQEMQQGPTTHTGLYVLQ